MRFLSCLLMTLFTAPGFAATLCLVQADPSKSAFENTKIQFLILNQGIPVASSFGEAAETDSAPFGNVIVNYRDAQGQLVTAIHYRNGNPVATAFDQAQPEVVLEPNIGQTTAQGACFDFKP